MNARMRNAAEQTVVQFKGRVKSLAEEAATIRDEAGVDGPERRIRPRGSLCWAGPRRSCFKRS